MPNGSFLTYKRRRPRKKRDLAWRGRSAAEPISDASLSDFLLHSFPVQGFEEARAVSRIARVRPAAPPTCSLFCVSKRTGIGICSPPCSLFACIYSVPIVGCSVLITHLFACIYIYVYFRLSRLPVLASVCVLCVEGPCPCVVFGPA